MSNQNTLQGTGSPPRPTFGDFSPRMPGPLDIKGKPTTQMEHESHASMPPSSPRRPPPKNPPTLAKNVTTQFEPTVQAFAPPPTFQTVVPPSSAVTISGSTGTTTFALKPPNNSDFQIASIRAQQQIQDKLTSGSTYFSIDMLDPNTRGKTFTPQDKLNLQLQMENLQNELSSIKQTLSDAELTADQNNREIANLHRELDSQDSPDINLKFSAAKKKLDQCDTETRFLEQEVDYLNQEVSSLDMLNLYLQQELFLLKGLQEKNDANKRNILSGIFFLMTKSGSVEKDEPVDAIINSLHDTQRKVDESFMTIQNRHNQTLSNVSTHTQQNQNRINFHERSAEDYQREFKQMSAQGTNPFDAYPDVIDQNDSPQCIQYTSPTMNEIYACTLDKLVCCVTSEKMEKQERYSLSNLIIFSYQTFTTSKELFFKMMKRYRPSFNNAKSPQTQRHVLEFLSLWVSLYPQDFHSNTELFHCFYLFVYNVCTDSSVAHTLLRTIHRNRNASSLPGILVGPKPIYPTSLGKIEFQHISPIELARQFALLNFEIFKNLQQSDLLDPKAFSKSTVLDQMSKRFNHITLLAQASVLNAETKKSRIDALGQIISTAKECRKINDYHTLLALMNAFNCPQIVRLKALVELFRSKLSSVQKTELQEILDLTSLQNNYKILRTDIRKANPPFVPFIGGIQSDIVFVYEGNPDFVQSENSQLINISKRKLLAEICRMVYSCQQKPYQFTPIPQIREFLIRPISATDDDLFEWSYKIEPRIV